MGKAKANEVLGVLAVVRPVWEPCEKTVPCYCVDGNWQAGDGCRYCHGTKTRTVQDRREIGQSRVTVEVRIDRAAICAEMARAAAYTKSGRSTYHGGQIVSKVISTERLA
jgi:hypothetical protein